MWTQAEAIALCKRIEAVAPTFGAHVGLTGGLLYKDGPRKDCDIILYRIREAKIDRVGLFLALANHGFDFKLLFVSAWIVKVETKDGKRIDFFFPDEPDTGEYVGFDEDGNELPF